MFCGLKLHMMVIVKALLSLYSIKLSTIHEAWNAKELCVCKNPALSGLFLLYNTPLFYHRNSMAAASPSPGELTTDRVKPWIFGKLVTSSIESRRFGCKGRRG